MSELLTLDSLNPDTIVYLHNVDAEHILVQTTWGHVANMKNIYNMLKDTRELNIQLGSQGKWTIPIPYIQPEQLETVVEYMRIENTAPVTLTENMPLSHASILRKLNDREQRFYINRLFTTKQAFDIIEAAELLGVDNLFRLVALRIGIEFVDHTSEQLRDMFSLTDDIPTGEKRKFIEESRHYVEFDNDDGGDI